MRVLFSFDAKSDLEKEAMCSCLRELYMGHYDYNFDNLKDYVFRTEHRNLYYILFDDKDDLEKRGLLDKEYNKNEILRIFEDTVYHHAFDFDKQMFKSEMKNYNYYRECIMEQATPVLMKWFNEKILDKITVEGAHEGRGGMTVYLNDNYSVKIILNFMDLYDVTFYKEDLELEKVKDVYFDYLQRRIDTDLKKVMV